MGNTYPNPKGNYYYRNHTLYHIGTLDPLGNRSDSKNNIVSERGQYPRFILLTDKGSAPWGVLEVYKLVRLKRIGLEIFRASCI